MAAFWRFREDASSFGANFQEKHQKIRCSYVNNRRLYVIVVEYCGIAQDPRSEGVVMNIDAAMQGVLELQDRVRSVLYGPRPSSLAVDVERTLDDLATRHAIDRTGESDGQAPIGDGGAEHDSSDAIEVRMTGEEILTTCIQEMQRASVNIQRAIGAKGSAEEREGWSSRLRELIDCIHETFTAIQVEESAKLDLYRESKENAAALLTLLAAQGSSETSGGPH